MRFLLDTNTCIRLLRGDRNVQRKLAEQSPADCAISVIVSYELYTGVEKCEHPERERRKVENLLGTVNRLDFSQDHPELQRPSGPGWNPLACRLDHTTYCLPAKRLLSD